MLDVIFHHGLGGLRLIFEVFDGDWVVCNPDDDDILKYRVPTHALYHKFDPMFFILDDGVMRIDHFFA